MAEGDSKKSAGGNWVDLSKIIAMPLVTLIVGYLINNSLNHRQARDQKVLLYANMMGSREQADSALRKDMFTSILGTFLKKDPKQPPEQALETDILNIELLAFNFHESLDLGPLFKHIQRELGEDKRHEELRWRLERVASEVKERQLDVLGETGKVERGDISVGTEVWRFGAAAVQPKANETSAGPVLCLGIDSSDGVRRHRQFKIEYLQFKRREVQFRLTVSRPLEETVCKGFPRYEDEKANTEVSVEFWAGMFAFPMIDNSHLSHSERCSVSVTRITMPEGEPATSVKDVTVDVAIAYFQASRASLKDKPYYDEVLHDLLEGPAASNPKEP